jgi:hypothetical protein
MKNSKFDIDDAAKNRMKEDEEERICRFHDKRRRQRHIEQKRDKDREG